MRNLCKKSIEEVCSYVYDNEMGDYYQFTWAISKHISY